MENTGFNEDNDLVEVAQEISEQLGEISSHLDYLSGQVGENKPLYRSPVGNSLPLKIVGGIKAEAEGEYGEAETIIYEVPDGIMTVFCADYLIVQRYELKDSPPGKKSIRSRIHTFTNLEDYPPYEEMLRLHQESIRAMRGINQEIGTD